MPEGPELYYFANFITRYANTKVFDGIETQFLTLRSMSNIKTDHKQFTIKARSSGKQMGLLLSELEDIESDGTPCQDTVIIAHFGLAGSVRTGSVDELRADKSVKLIFTTKDKGLGLIFKSFTGGWDVEKGPFEGMLPIGPVVCDGVDPAPAFPCVFRGKTRGPCIINEPHKAVARIREKMIKRFSKTPFCVLLLNQELFNGVGNYLRAEIIGELGIKPFERSDIVFLNDIKHCYPNKEIESLEEVESLTVNELENTKVIKTIINKTQKAVGYVFGVSGDFEKDYIKVYGKAKNAAKDSSGRCIWYNGPWDKRGKRIDDNHIRNESSRSLVLDEDMMYSPKVDPLKMEVDMVEGTGNNSPDTAYSASPIKAEEQITKEAGATDVEPKTSTPTIVTSPTTVVDEIKDVPKTEKVEAIINNESNKTSDIKME